MQITNGGETLNVLKANSFTKTPIVDDDGKHLRNNYRWDFDGVEVEKPKPVSLTYNGFEIQAAYHWSTQFRDEVPLRGQIRRSQWVANGTVLTTTPIHDHELEQRLMEPGKCLSGTLATIDVGEWARPFFAKVISDPDRLRHTVMFAVEADIEV
jgi:hypothetical protein